MTTSDYVLVRNWTMVSKDGRKTHGQTTYMLPEYDAEATVEELIRQSTSACAASLVSTKDMKKKRILSHKEKDENGKEIDVTDGIVWGPK